ncbi:putative pectinesterase 29 [Senna tora]|uniref:pectinesterase n=1 Tax=Senna tora TaxID=362788 RepID=A0A834TTC9_9FABA|nr:putative pectinesterase 29 [Senna tora]
MGREGPPERGGCITANRRSSDEDSSAFVFKNCTITGNGKGLASLGRAYGDHSRVIIANSFLGDVVAPQGWVAWTAVGHE